jgi:hypothetical protein
VTKNKLIKTKKHLCSKKHKCMGICSHPGVCSVTYTNLKKKFSKNDVDREYDYI